MSKNDGVGRDQNPNARTIEILQRMADYYERTNDHWRPLAYRKAISALRVQPHKVMTAKEAISIRSIGSRLADKIEEIVWTGWLRRLENTTDEPTNEALQIFTGIYGVGTSQATKWIDQGHRRLQDLVENAQMTKNQKIGIEHYEEFRARIPRTEMDRHDQYIRETCRKIDATL